MKKIFYPIAIALTISISAYAAAVSMNWKIAEGYHVKFTSDDPSGEFTSLKGNVSFDENNLKNSSFDVTIDVKSFSSGNGMQNRQAMTAKWFDAEKYPEIKFTSSDMTKKGKEYIVKGTMVMHGVTKEMSIPFSFEKTTTGGLFKGTFNVNRNDFKIGEPGGHASDVLRIDLSVPVLPK